VGCTHMYLIPLAPKSRILETGKVKSHSSSLKTLESTRFPSHPLPNHFPSCANTGVSSRCVATEPSWPDQAAISSSSSFKGLTTLPIALDMTFRSRCHMNAFPTDEISGGDTLTITAPGSAGTTDYMQTGGVGREMRIMGLGRKG
jgi:hypothetical protein